MGDLLLANLRLLNFRTRLYGSVHFLVSGGPAEGKAIFIVDAERPLLCAGNRMDSLVEGELVRRIVVRRMLLLLALVLWFTVSLMITV